jgi:hypothetical protein
MPKFIVFETKNNSFLSEAKIVMQSNGFTDVNAGEITYKANSGDTSKIVSQLKNLDIYKKNSSSIKIYHGNLS